MLSNGYYIQIDPTLIHTSNLEDGATALHLAVDFREVQFRNDSGAVKVLEYLLDFINVNLVDDLNVTPLHLAC